MPVTINREPVKPVTTPIKDVVLTSEGGSGRSLTFRGKGCWWHHPVEIELQDAGYLRVSTDTARQMAAGLIELCDQIDGDA